MTWPTWSILVTIFGWLIVVGEVACAQDSWESRYQNLIEKNTCFSSVMSANDIKAIWVWDNYLEMVYQSDLIKNYFMYYRIRSKTKPRVEPFFHILEGSAVQTLRSTIQIQVNFTENKYQSLVDNYLTKYRTVYFFPIDYSTVLFVFEKNDQENLMLTYGYKEMEYRNIEIITQSIIEKGTIPMLLFEKPLKSFEYDQKNPEKIKDLSKVNFSTVAISNVDYSYKVGWLGVSPQLKLTIDQTYYYGFNRNMTSIYFASKLDLLENQIQKEYLPASQVITKKWHPFRCYDYIYLYISEWILIFPVVDLNHYAQISNNSVLYASVTVMHRNSLIWCTSDQSKVPKPVYPNRSIFMLGTNEPLRPPMTTSLSSIQSLTSKLSPLALILLVFGVVILFLLACFLMILRQGKRGGRFESFSSSIRSAIYRHRHRLRKRRRSKQRSLSSTQSSESQSRRKKKEKKRKKRRKRKRKSRR